MSIHHSAKKNTTRPKKRINFYHEIMVIGHRPYFSCICSNFISSNPVQNLNPVLLCCIFCYFTCVLSLKGAGWTRDSIRGEGSETGHDLITVIRGKRGLRTVVSDCWFSALYLTLTFWLSTLTTPSTRDRVMSSVEKLINFTDTMLRYQLQ
jgi:hypothetical protein